MSPRLFLRCIVAFNLMLIGVSVGLGLFKTGNPSRYFGEGRYTTFISAAQLLSVGVLAWLTFQQRRRTPAPPGSATLRLRGQHYVWLLVAAGFVFLAVDEIMELHERMDRLVLRALELPVNPLTGRLDDMIMAGFGLIGLAILGICRQELLPFRQAMKGPMLAGFIGLFLMVLCDTAAHDDHFFLWLTGDLSRARTLNGWFSALEGGLTLVPEGLFMAAFYAAWYQSHPEKPPAIVTPVP